MRMSVVLKKEDDLAHPDFQVKKRERNVDENKVIIEADKEHEEHSHKDLLPNVKITTHGVTSDRSSPVRMELRKSRKATIKKRLLMEAEVRPKRARHDDEHSNLDVATNNNDDNNNNENETDIVLLKSETSDKEKDRSEKKTTKSESGLGVSSVREDDSEHSNGDSVTTIDSSSSMTLEQFSEIVLASEGLSVEAGCSERNNNHVKSKEAHTMAVSLMKANTDLIVEVKRADSPIKEKVEGKPVVLLPRQPDWHADMYGGNNYAHATAGPSFGLSTVVAVKPRTTNTNGLKLETSAVRSDVGSPASVASEPASPIRGNDTALNLSMKKQVAMKQGPVSVPPATASRSTGRSTTTTPSTPTTSPGSVSGSSASTRLVARAMPLEHKAISKASSSKSASVASAGSSEKTKSDGALGRALRDLQSAHVKDAHGNCPLHRAVLMHKPGLVRRLCCALTLLDASVDIVNDDKMTPLHLAVREGSLSSLEVLLFFGADPGLRDGSRGNSSLHIAAARRDAAAIRCLVKQLRHKNDINALNANGITPLHITTAQSDTASAEVLIEHGADPTVPDAIHGLSPLDMAKQDKLASSSSLVLSKRPLSATSSRLSTPVLNNL